MIEIGTEAELFHPPYQVWRTLTEQPLLAKWFAETTPVPDAPGQLLMRTAGLPGFDGDVEAAVVEWRVSERLVLRCREGDRHTRLIATLTPTGHGCRLSVHEVLEQGDWDAEQRARRAEHHQQAVAVRLPAILDWLAFQQVDLRRAEGGMTAELPAVRLLGDGRTRARRLWAVVIGALVCLALAGAGVWAARRPAPRLPEATPHAAPLVQPTASRTAPRPTPSRPTPAATRHSATPSATATPTRTRSAAAPPAEPLTARYATVADRLLGYRGEVTVTNPGSVARPGWTVTVTIGARARLGAVDGAEGKQDGQRVTFTGPAVPARGAVTFRFDVRDPAAQEPDACTVDGKPCTGL